MRGFEIAKILVVKNLKKNTIRMPRRASADEFAVGGSKRVEDGVVEFLVVSYKVEFVSVNHMQGGSADGFWVVWEGFYAASVGKVDLGSLRFEGCVWWKFVCEGSDVGDNAFSLAP